MLASILISSYNRTRLFRRTLYSIVKNKPSVPFEVVVADDGSTEDILKLLNEFSSQFTYKFIRVNTKIWEKKTSLKKFYNNPAFTNNVAFKNTHPDSELIFLMGNEIIVWQDSFNKLIAESANAHKERGHYLAFTTTYDMPQFHLDKLDTYGTNLNQSIVDECKTWPLQSKSYHSDVTNYLSLTPRWTWEKIQGYDERLIAGIAKDDSDFVRRARAIPEGCTTFRSEAISLHQHHGGMNMYHNPDPQNITMDKWNQGLEATRPIWENWDGSFENRQGWPIGEYGVEDIITNVK